MNLISRSYKKELLDRDDIPFADIAQNMRELDFINTWLRGHSINIKGLNQLAGNSKQLHICEIGCGGGDNLIALHKWCSRHNIKPFFTGIDIKQSCIDVASAKKDLKVNTNWITSDYQLVKFGSKPDVIFSSLFCHHFTEAELINQLQWMKANSTIGFFINDLQRNTVAYYAIKLLTKLFSKSYLVKNDAPLSVARGFKKKEWQNILQQAGITNYILRWQWAFRYLITYKHAR